MMPIYTTPFVDVLSLSLFQFFFSSHRQRKTKRSCSLTNICPESVLWWLVHVHSFQFLCEAVPLSPLSPCCPFCPAEPWIPGSPFSPFFPSAPRGPWVPVFPGLPRSPLAPSRPGAPGAPGIHVMYVHIPACPLSLQDGQDETGCQK